MDCIDRVWTIWRRSNAASEYAVERGLAWVRKKSVPHIRTLRGRPWTRQDRARKCPCEVDGICKASTAFAQTEFARVRRLKGASVAAAHRGHEQDAVSPFHPPRWMAQWTSPSALFRHCICFASGSALCSTQTRGSSVEGENWFPVPISRSAATASFHTWEAPGSGSLAG